VRDEFASQNVKVYVLAVSEANLGDAILSLRTIGLIGPGYTVLRPNTATAYSADLTHHALTGSIGVQPHLSKVDSGDLAAVSNWTALLATAAQLPKQSIPQPRGALGPPLGLNPRYIWDATFLAARGIADALTQCELSPATGRPHLSCQLRQLRNNTLDSVITGSVRLASDGMTSFDIMNFVEGDNQRRGGVNITAGVSIDIRSIVWSDGVTGRSVAPRWGQESIHMTLPSPTGSIARQDGLIGIFAGMVLLVVVAILSIYAHKRRRKRRSSIFHEVRR
jgi:hypothetical protein